MPYSIISQRTQKIFFRPKIESFSYLAYFHHSMITSIENVKYYLDDVY